MINKALQDSINMLLSIRHRVINICVGSIGGFSIEIETSEPISFESYLYTNQKDRDKDFIELKKLF